MTRPDPLGGWWRHEIRLEEFLEDDSWGSGYGPARTEHAAIDATTRLVRDSSGKEVVSTTTVALPATAGYVPPGSRVTLPAGHGGRTATVIACQVADGGGLPTPDHVALHLE